MPQYQIRFGVGYDRDSRKIQGVYERLEAVHVRTAKIFGGYSYHEGNGGWLNSANELVREPNGVLAVDTDFDRLKEVIGLVRFIGREFNQHSVHLTVFPGIASENVII